MWVRKSTPSQPELLRAPEPLGSTLVHAAPSGRSGLTEIRLRHGHGPLGCWGGRGCRVEVHGIQGLIHRLPRVLPCGDFFYVIEEVPLASGREGHLPARGQWQLVGHIVGLLAEVRMLLRWTACSTRAGAQLQGRGRRV